ncbi:MAG: AbrB/MazE/SpoVT family DNA-binding domain-containing protein [Halococcoides sp.]
MEVTADDGRVYLPKETREKFGTRYELVDRGDRLLLVPLPDDPLATLRAEAADSSRTVEELAAGAHEEALEEAGR